MFKWGLPAHFYLVEYIRNDKDATSKIKYQENSGSVLIRTLNPQSLEKVRLVTDNFVEKI